MDTFLPALGYTLLMGIVAFYYWIEGNKRGIKETIHIIMQHEPEALMRIRPKLKEILNETDA
jgi:hypothetical protein